MIILLKILFYGIFLGLFITILDIVFGMPEPLCWVFLFLGTMIIILSGDI